MAHILVEDIAYVRFSAPDLGAMGRFLTDFGLVPSLAPDGHLYARACGEAPFVHVTEQGEPSFVALGLRAACLEDLERLAAANHADVEALNAPGGGHIVTLTGPDGHRIEVVTGQNPVAPLPLLPEPKRNSAYGHMRDRAPVRLDSGPSTVHRIGHAVLEVTDFRAAEAWFKERFGFLTSDQIELEPGAAIGAFLRCDRGDLPTDHHTLFLLQSPRAPAFNHAAFEVAHIDDLMRGHDYLKRAGCKPAWGIGRHILGSQIFDYWQDPWGHELEHWTDGDRFNRADPPGVAGIPELIGVQWGQRHPLNSNS